MFVQGKITPNLRYYVTSEDYNIHAGTDWPSYSDYLAGMVSTDAEVLDEMVEFTRKFVAQGVKFPIKTATACQSKWTWSTIWLNERKSSSCHRVESDLITLDDFDNFHNTPGKIQARELMLQGQWPGYGCEYCRDIERAGGVSDRMHNLAIRGLTPPELLSNPKATHITPRLIEIFAQNTCNLSCTYCNGNLSSKIEEESQKYGEFKKGDVFLPRYDTTNPDIDLYFDKFLNWLENNIQNLDRLHLLGGETFIQHKLMTSVLDIIERCPNPNLQLCTFSNFNVPDRIWFRYIDRIRDLQRAGNIKVFDLTASIDCWGPQAMYVRHGLNLNQFEEKFAWAAEQSDWLRLNINQTITVLTIKTMPELIEKMTYYSKYKHIGHYFEMHIGHQLYQHPNIFSYSQWHDDFNRIIAAMPTDTPEQQEAIPRMQGIQKYLQSVTQNNTEQINNLQVWLNELDRRRGTNWQELFPFIKNA